ncbi:flagellar biosynthesis anti-sigma factor FlgM [Bryobacter aggregatus]|uniref:flagellar biosynthesis anti-sigma factor FlgM n=1 Tax=Bryobacter aggregatus TaxID=360054 RepID=UPI0004E22A33|nr:flagellar biosynthesis anti-sigma factor FlgM [Bryobacter aggregatus]
MRVNDPNQNPAVGQSGSAGAAGKTAQLDPIKISTGTGQSIRGSERGDEVQLSSLSSKINQLQSGSAEREAYLQQLQSEVATGQYQPDPAEIASSLVENLLTKNG